MEGEIKKREVSWTLTKKLDAFAGPGEIKSREVELGLRVGLLLLQLFPSGGATDIVFVTLFLGQQLGQQLRGAVVAAHYRMDTALTFCCSGSGPRHPWSSGLAPVSRFYSSVPLFPLVPVPNRPTCLR